MRKSLKTLHTVSETSLPSGCISARLKEEEQLDSLSVCTNILDELMNKNNLNVLGVFCMVYILLCILSSAEQGK